MAAIPVGEAMLVYIDSASAEKRSILPSFYKPARWRRERKGCSNCAERVFRLVLSG
jgi:hypothetical protein